MTYAPSPPKKIQSTSEIAMETTDVSFLDIGLFLLPPPPQKKEDILFQQKANERLCMTPSTKIAILLLSAHKKLVYGNQTIKNLGT